MNVRTPATTLVVALIAGACTIAGEVNGAAGESGGPASAPSDTIVSSDGSTMSVLRHSYGDSLEEVAAQFELTVLVRATDNAWTTPMPGHPPKDEWPDDEKQVADTMPDFHWREFEVVEVLSGSYDYETLNYGDLLDHAHAGETYLLIVSVLTISSPDQDPNDWPPRYSDQHFNGAVPPYLLTADKILTSTDPTIYPQLDETLALSDARARLGDGDGDTDSQDRQTEPLEVPKPLPSLDEQQDG